MLPTSALSDELAVVVAREVAPHEVPVVIAGAVVPSLGTDGSPSRDRLARIAAMIHDAELAATALGVGENSGGRLIPLIPLMPRGERGRPLASGAAVIDLAG
jgi:hypothetical protein